MKIVNSLVNRSESLVFKELEHIGKDNGFRVHAKVRLSDIIEKAGSHLSQREFDFFTRSHCDFAITDFEHRPIMIIEYDGPMHSNVEQVARDEIKDDLLQRAGLGLLRINSRHVTKLYRGMTVLRWILEVAELKKGFDSAQVNGQVPADEPFDPLMFLDNSGQLQFPYWLSAPANRQINSFLYSLGPAMEGSWSGAMGFDLNHTAYRLSVLRFGVSFLWATTAVRKQDLDFPHYDLASEIDICELGAKLSLFQKGKVRASTKQEFELVRNNFCERYETFPSFNWGESLFDKVSQ